MYDYIRPQKILDSLRYLKANNPLYADIDINEHWVEDDEELCQYLVEQEDESMDTQCEDDTAPNVAMSVQSEPMECSDENDELSTALLQLKALAHQKCFTIHNVPFDGDCMFSAISYQLQTNDVCSADSNGLRQMAADYLDANAPLYRDFLCQLVPSEDGSYTADTAQPTPEDEFINSVSDPQLQSELRWQKYVRCLRQQAIADMLSVKICVFSNNHPLLSVTPGVCRAECEVFVGLILQYHYVGLDRVPVCGTGVNQFITNVQSNPSVNTADVQDNPSVNTADVQDNPSVNTADVQDNPSVNTADVQDNPSVNTADVQDNPSVNTADVQDNPSVNTADVQDNPSVNTADVQDNPSINTADIQSNPSINTDNTADVQSNPSINTDNTADVQSNPSINTDNTADVQSNPSINTDNTAEEALDDITIEEGDEYRRQISGADVY